MRFFKLLLNACSIAFLLNSCSNNNTSPTNAPVQNQSFTVNIDGVPYTATSFNASKNTYTSSNGTIVQSYSISGNLYSGTGGKTVNVQFFESPTNTYTTNSSNSSTGIGTGNFGYISDITAALSNTFSTVNQSLTPTIVGQIAVSLNNSTIK